MPFEFPPPLTGDGPFVQVLDPSGTAPRIIIDTDHDFRVRVRWSLERPAADLLGDDWIVQVYAESIGPGPEQRLGVETVPVSSGSVSATQVEFTGTINVPAGTLPAEAANRSGVYMLVAVVTYNGAFGPTVLAGFEQGPVIQLRDP
jgi:hypothetical protein